MIAGCPMELMLRGVSSCTLEFYPKGLDYSIKRLGLQLTFLVPCQGNRMMNSLDNKGIEDSDRTDRILFRSIQVV